MKRALIVATVPSMIEQFNMDNARILKNQGFEVMVACNFKDRSFYTEEKTKKFIERLKTENIKYFQVDFSRTPINILGNIKSYKQVAAIIDKYKINLIHSHTPVAGVISRIAAHFKKVKVIYTAHGFHFYKGAPKVNWMIYYPIEKFLSKWTDVLITINKEDFLRAKHNFYMKEIQYVPGVGIDTDRFQNGLIDIKAKRAQLGVNQDEIMILSVGELSERKNHEVVIRAISEIVNQNIKYFIAGIGPLKDHLNKLAKDLGIEDKIILLGYRNDVSELCQAADVFVFPSHQEGLPVSLMEAIACKTKVICSKIRGNTDLVLNKNNLFNEYDPLSLCACLNRMISGVSRSEFLKNSEEDIERNYEHLEVFKLSNVQKNMQKIYEKF